MLKKSNIELIALNLIALSFYILVFLSLQIQIDANVMFSTPDAQSYWRVSQWIEEGVQNISVSMRPFLFPLIITISKFLGGVKALWLIQFFFLDFNHKPFLFIASRNY